MLSKLVALDEVKIYCEIEGEGETLVALHGGPGIPHGYVCEMRALATQLKLVFFDQRGTGKSSKTCPNDYTLEANVEDLENIRLELGLGRIALFGHSWGGMLAQAYALRYQRNLTKLILANTFSSVDQLNRTLAQMRASLPETTQRSLEKYEREGLYKNRDRYPHEYQAAVDMAYKAFSLNVPTPAYFQEAFQNLAWDVYRTMWGEESEFKITGTMKGFNFLPHLHEIHLPTLVLVGRHDMTSVEMAEETAHRIPDARLVIFENSRHYPFIEEKQKFLDVMRNFLRGG